jgi:hypothetical protein
VIAARSFFDMDALGELAFQVVDYGFRNSDGLALFTMKKLSGLSQVLLGTALGDKEIRKVLSRYPAFPHPNPARRAHVWDLRGLCGVVKRCYPDLGIVEPFEVYASALCETLLSGPGVPHGPSVFDDDDGVSGAHLAGRMIDDLEEEKSRIALALRRERFSKQKFKDLVFDLRERLQEIEAKAEDVRQITILRTAENVVPQICMISVALF